MIRHGKHIPAGPSARTPYDPSDQGDQGDDTGVEFYDWEAAQLKEMRTNELAYQERIYQAADRCAADEERLSRPALPEEVNHERT